MNKPWVCGMAQDYLGRSRYSQTDRSEIGRHRLGQIARNTKTSNAEKQANCEHNCDHRDHSPDPLVAFQNLQVNAS